MKRCLIVVDYQKDFVDGSLGCPQAKSIEDAIAAKIHAYRQQGDDILFTLDTHTDQYLSTQEGQHLPVVHCVESTPGHGLYGKVAQLQSPDDLTFRKNTFGSSGLYEHLCQTPYQSIELVGVVTNICVISNAVLAKTAQPETPITVDAQCVASNDPAMQQAALDVMATLQINISNRKD